MPSVAEAVAWSRRTFAWSNSAEAWRDRLGWLLWLAIGYGFYRWCAAASNLGPVHLVVGIGLFAALVAIGLVTDTGFGRLLGPVLFYDILRNARRGRFILLRWLYAVALLLLLLWVHMIWQMERSRNGTVAADYKALAKLAEQYFVAFSIVQFLLVALITPAYVAGAIAEEKDRKTLEFLLATDLDNREIVLGKLVSRMGNLALFVMTGLPVLSLMQFFGGIDPGLLLASFAATAITAVSLCGLSILNSVLRRRARDAIVFTYLAVVGYLVVTGVTFFVEQMIFHHYKSLSWAGIEWGPVFDRFHAGNPIFGLVAVITTINSNGPLPSVIAAELEKYAVFHGLVAAMCIIWAVLRLRAVALGESAVITRKPKGLANRILRRKPVGPKPMLWKELRVEGRLKLGVLGRVVVALLIGVGFVPVIMIVYFAAIERANAQAYLGVFDWFGLVIGQMRSHWDEIGTNINAWLRTLNVVVSVLMLLGVAVRAAGSIGGERDRDTLLSLMTTTLTTREIMIAKWWGALASIRGFLWWLAGVWLVALVFGAVNPVAVLLHACAWLAPAACFASIGLWFSATCRTSLRATAWTIVTAILVGGGHWLCMAMCCYVPGSFGGGGRSLEAIVTFELSLTPPFVFGWDAVRELDHLQFPRSESGMPVFAVVGMAIWVIAAAIVYQAAHARFARLTNRIELWRPEMALPMKRQANRDAPPTLPSQDSDAPPYRSEGPVV